MFAIESLPKTLFEKKNAPLLSGILRGVEREALRVDFNGCLSNKPHPEKLGSALTHPQVTTDFSEALLEFITPPTHQIDDLFLHLEAIQRFVLSHLDQETLWPSSMPCTLGNEADIPVAQYGACNNGRMKTVYRIGLGHRYGRAMQTVAGIHYNFSLPNAFWAFLIRQQNRLNDLQAFKDEGYFNLIRNFRRHYWLLMYLFGASPALCKSFVDGKPHSLHTMPDEHTLYLPDATSLRMGDLGYQSQVQESLYVCYNNKASYIQSLCCAITRPHPEYEDIGLKDLHGNYKQLNTSILQIENEFYSAIRPKRTSRPGETALAALQNRGVEYIEVRCVDINPFNPLGITREQVHFLDTFLTYCALQKSPMTDPDEFSKILHNQKCVVNRGRHSGLELQDHLYGKLTLQDWGRDLVENMRPVAELLDFCFHTENHQAALDDQKNKLSDSELTPSAKMIRTLKQDQLSFSEFSLKLAKEHHQMLNEKQLDSMSIQRMAQMAEKSLLEQDAMEAANEEAFDDFIRRYYSQYRSCAG